MNAQRVKLNLVPGGISPIVHVSQYDVGRVLEFALYDGVGIAEIESGTSIDIRGTKPDKTGFSYPCTFSGNVVSIATREQMTAVSGSFDCELHLVKDTQDIGTANFILEVEPAALSSDTNISETEIPVIIDLARRNQQAASAAQLAAETAQSAAETAQAAAEQAETNAFESSVDASNSARLADGSAQSAAASKASAVQSADAASTSSRYATEYASSASASATAAANSKSDSEAYARGTRNGTAVDSSDETYHNNSKYYAEVAQAAAAGGIIPQGTCTFANLPSVASAHVGDMWNVSDDFTTTSDFREGANVPYGAGSNVYKTSDGKWDVTSGRMIMMTGATSSTAGTAGAMTAPTAGQQNYVYKGSGQWQPLSYVGMIIHSTTLNTEAKVKEFYGGTKWIQHSGYVLRGATSATANSAAKDGGADSVTPSGTISGGAVQSHVLTVNEIPSHNHKEGLNRGGTSSNNGGDQGYKWHDDPNGTKATLYTGGGQGHTHDFTQPTFKGTQHTNLPQYKNVYIWERTA